MSSIVGWLLRLFLLWVGLTAFVAIFNPLMYGTFELPDTYTTWVYGIGELVGNWLHWSGLDGGVSDFFAGVSRFFLLYIVPASIFARIVFHPVRVLLYAGFVILMTFIVTIL